MLADGENIEKRPLLMLTIGRLLLRTKPTFSIWIASLKTADGSFTQRDLRLNREPSVFQICVRSNTASQLQEIKLVLPDTMLD